MVSLAAAAAAQAPLMVPVVPAGTDTTAVAVAVAYLELAVVVVVSLAAAAEAAAFLPVGLPFLLTAVVVQVAVGLGAPAKIPPVLWAAMAVLGQLPVVYLLPLVAAPVTQRFKVATIQAPAEFTAALHPWPPPVAAVALGHSLT